MDHSLSLDDYTFLLRSFTGVVNVVCNVVLLVLCVEFVVSLAAPFVCRARAFSLLSSFLQLFSLLSSARINKTSFRRNHTE